MLGKYTSARSAGFSFILSFLLLVSFLSIPTFLHSQQRDFCHSQPSSGSVQDISSVSPVSGSFFVRIAVYVIRDGNGNGGQTVENVEEALSYLDAGFNPHDIYFVRNCDEINYIDSDNYFNKNPSDLSSANDVFEEYGNPETINIFLFPDTSPELQDGVGLADGMPGDTSNDLLVMGSFQNPTMPLVRSFVVAHEMGHCLGLYHTHEGSQPVGDPNCSGAGDRVCDTLADPSLSFEFDVTPPDGMGGGCEWIASPVDQMDLNGNIYEPDLHNIMSYTNLNCMEAFTEGQGTRMKILLSIDPVLQACLVPEPEFYFDEVVRSDATWTSGNTPNGGDILIENNLVVDCGAKLTIEDDVIVRFKEGGRLIVKQGAQLELKGILTSETSGTTWSGVEVWGNSEASQISIYEANAQGSFFGRPDALIENADTGVKLFRPNHPFTSGGRIYCSGMDFKDNRIGVEFAPYRNFWPYSWPSGWLDQPRSYAGSFSSCDFLTTDSYPHSSGFNSFLYLVGVNGIRINACNFINTQSNIVGGSGLESDYGNGIYAIDSGFKVLPSCQNTTYPCNSYTHSTFVGLGVGILTTAGVAAPEESMPYTVKQADFTNCHFGIKNSAVSKGTILFNNFNLGNVPNSSINNGEQFGVFFEYETDGFTMQENDFVGTSGNASATIGTHCVAIGSHSNTIRKNRYQNLNYGNVAEGVNATGPFAIIKSGLTYLCNENSNINESDFAVTVREINGQPIVPNMIYENQGLQDEVIGGNNFKSAGNEFSGGAGLNFINDGNEIEYFFFAPIANQVLNANESSGEIVLTGVNSSDLQNTCPEDYCEPPCKTQSELVFEKSGYYNDRVKRESAKSQEYAAEQAGDLELAVSKKTEANFYQRQMDEQAFMVVLHMMHDTLYFNADSLSLWLTNLDAYGTNMIWALSEQSAGNTAEAAQILNRIADDPDLNEIQISDVQDARLLMQLLENKSAYYLSKEDLKELEKFADRNIGLIGAISRNILTLHGYRFPTIYNLPRARERSDISSLSKIPAEKDVMRLYPNPSNGMFNLDWHEYENDSEEGVLRVTDLSGKTVLNKTVLPASVSVIDLSNNAKGIYFYQFTVNGKTFQSGKLIVK